MVSSPPPKSTAPRIAAAPRRGEGRAGSRWSACRDASGAAAGTLARNCRSGRDPVSSPAIAASIAIALAAAWTLGSCAVPSRPALERLGAGLLAVYAVAGAAMLQGPLHVSFLAHTWAVRAASAAGLAALLAWRRPSLRPAGVRPAALAGGTALVALMALPAWRSPVGSHPVSHQDMQWHEGWIRQLLGGAHAPGGVYAGEPNSYPWLYHSLTAWIAQALPGGVDEALVVVDVLGLVTIAAGMWLLARELGAGAPAAAVAMVLAVAGGGFGWVWQHAPAAVLNMSGGDLGRYHGDLVLSNALVPGMGNLPPLVPRDLGVCMAPLVLWAFVRALDARSRTGLLAAGAAGGLAFLCAPLAGLFLAAWAAGLALRTREPLAGWTALAGVAVAAVWLAPLAVTYHRYGGFVDITSTPPTNPTVVQAAVALGIVLPLGLAGLVLAVRAPGGADAWRIGILVADPGGRVHRRRRGRRGGHAARLRGPAAVAAIRPVPGARPGRPGGHRRRARPPRAAADRPPGGRGGDRRGRRSGRRLDRAGGGRAGPGPCAGHSRSAGRCQLATATSSR